jgi:hypothetical protein
MPFLVFALLAMSILIVRSVRTAMSVYASIIDSFTRSCIDTSLLCTPIQARSLPLSAHFFSSLPPAILLSIVATLMSIRITSLGAFAHSISTEPD